VKYLGIDPGKSGGVALVGEDGLVEMFAVTPMIGKDYDVREMANILWRQDAGNTLVVLEKVHSMPGQGVASMFTFGEGYGLWQGMLAAIGLPFEKVSPRRWQKLVPKPTGVKGKEWKNALMAWAMQRWPDIPKHSGVCDAALMAEAMRRGL